MVYYSTDVDETLYKNSLDSVSRASRFTAKEIVFCDILNMNWMWGEKKALWSNTNTMHNSSFFCIVLVCCTKRKHTAQPVNHKQMTLMNWFLWNVFMGLKGTVMVKFLMISILMHSLLLFLLSLFFPPCSYFIMFLSVVQGSSIMSACLSLLPLKSPVKLFIHQSTHCTKPPISNTKYLCSYKLIQSLYNLIITVSEDFPSHLCDLQVCTAFNDFFASSGKLFNPCFSKPRRILSCF